MDPCVSFLTRLVVIAIIRGVQVDGVAINRGNEIVTFASCPEDTSTVFVDLKCPFQYSTASSSQFISTKWSYITDIPTLITVVIIDNNGTLLKSSAYENTNITRLSMDRLDGSIRLELQNTTVGDLRTFECEANVFGDSPSLDTRTVTVINTDPCLSSRTSAPCSCPTHPTCSCKTSTPTPDCEIKVCPKLGPGLAIAVALIGLCVAGFDIYMLLSKEKPIKGWIKRVVQILVAVGVGLGVTAIVLSALCLSQEPACILPYEGYDIVGAVCSGVELVCEIIALVIVLLKNQDFGGHSGGISLEMGNGRRDAGDPPKRPPSDISRKDVTVGLKQSGGQGRGSPRKNSVEPQEKKTNVPPMAVAAPRKLPPMPNVDVDTPVKPMKKKKKKKNLNQSDVIKSTQEQ